LKPLKYLCRDSVSCNELSGQAEIQMLQ
jgi:hypothetical protein